MAKNDLDFLIDDINYLINNHAQIFEEELDSLIVSALEEIGIEQIADTNTARSIFVDIAREQFGRDISYIYTDVTDIWGNLKRGRDIYSSTYSTGISRIGGLSVDIEIEDYGVYNQENYDNYPSDKRPDKELYEMGHITRVTEMIDNGLLPKFEYYLDRVENLFVEIIDGRG